MDGSPKIGELLTSQAILAIIIVTLTLGLTLILNEVQPKTGWKLLFVSLAFIVLIYSFLLWIFAKYLYVASHNIAQRVQATLDKYIGCDKIGWIITTEQMAEHEKSCSVSEIWLVSSDMSEDVSGGPFQDIVVANIKRGIKYRYFVPDKAEMRARIEQLRKNNNNSKNLSVSFLNDDFFFLVPRLDFAIYNPFKERGNERIAYMGIPAESDTARLHARIDNNLIDALIGKLMHLEDDNINTKKTPNRVRDGN